MRGGGYQRNIEFKGGGYLPFLDLRGEGLAKIFIYQKIFPSPPSK